MKSLRKIFLLGMVIWWAAGCTVVDDKPLPRTEADKKFVSILENDYSYKPVIRKAGETLWVYLPLDNASLYKIAAGQKTPPPKRKFTLEYADGTFKEKTFTFSQKGNALV